MLTCLAIQLNISQFQSSTRDSIELRAHPALIQKSSYLANLKGVRNGIEVDTDLIGTIHIAGSGAGQESTASGLISDIIHFANSNDNLLDISRKTNTLPIKDLIASHFNTTFILKPKTAQVLWHQ